MDLISQWLDRTAIIWVINEDKYYFKYSVFGNMAYIYISRILMINACTNLMASNGQTTAHYIHKSEMETIMS